jgi:hypothetical protein
MRDLIDAYTTTGRPFVRTRTANEIQASIADFAKRTLNLHSAR